LLSTAAKLGAEPKIVRRDVLAFLREPPSARFDVVFLDPPYAAPLDPLLGLLPAWLVPNALVYVERPRNEGLPAVPSASWVKQSYAGAVEYGLLRFEDVTMPKHPKSEEAT
jgi:16S rRNA (guanine966-N2)-methyltransferase